jgi:hypothetical protein
VLLGVALLAAAGLAAYHLLTASHHAAAVHAATGPGPPAAIHRLGHRAAPAPAATTPAPVPYAHTVVIHLRAAEDCWVEFTTPAAGTCSSWSSRAAPRSDGSSGVLWICGWATPAASS